MDVTPAARGSLAGKGKLEKEEIKRLFDFCRTFDLTNADSDSEYLFDVRSGAIHWLDRSTKNICSSLYCDHLRGQVKIQLGDVKEWTRERAFQKWLEVIKMALGVGASAVYE